MKRMISLVTAFVLCFSAVGCASARPEPKNEYEYWATIPEGVESVGLNQLVEAYETNQVAYNEQYSGKQFVVAGEVYEIGVSVFGSVYIIFRHSTGAITKQDMRIVMGSDENVALLKKGDTVGIMCTVEGKSLGELDGSDGVLVWRLIKE